MNQTRGSNVRSQLWYAMLDAERESRFFAKVADYNRRMHTTLAVSIMIMSLAAGVTLLLPAPALSTVISFLLIGSITAVMIVFDFSGRAQTARIVSEQTRAICLELKQLWYRGPETALPEFVSDLERRMDAIVRIDSTLNDKLNAQCAKDAYKVIEDEVLQRGAGTPAASAS